MYVVKYIVCSEVRGTFESTTYVGVYPGVAVSTTDQDRASVDRAPLNRGGIVAAACALAAAEGVRAVTMRKVAASLGYEVMSLYNHVANKNDLLGLMADSAADDVVEPEPDVEPLAGVRAIAMSMRANLVEHHWAAELWLRHPPGPARTRVMEDLLRLLDQSPLSPAMAHSGFHAVSNHVVGYTLTAQGMAQADDLDEGTQRFLDQLSPEKHPFATAHIQQHLDGDTGPSFELVLDLILEGLVRFSDQP